MKEILPVLDVHSHEISVDGTYTIDTLADLKRLQQTPGSPVYVGT